MEYKEVFFIIFIISSFLGIILAVLNNDSFITKKNRLNKENKNILRTKDNKNDIITIFFILFHILQQIYKFSPI